MAGRLSVEVNGLSRIALTHLDIFDDFPSIKICTAYELGNKVLRSFPSSTTTLEMCQPVYEELPGWEGSINDIRDFDKLPPKARHYITRLEELLSCPVSLVSVGAQRQQTIRAKTPFP